MAISAPLRKFDSSDARNSTRSAHSFGVPCRCIGIATRAAWGKGIAATAVKPGIGDLSGVDRIDPDVPLRELQHRCFGQPAQPPLAGSIGRVVMRGQSRSRRDVDDRAAAAVADRRRAMFHAEHCASQVDRQRPVPRLDSGIDDALARNRPGIVDQDVQFAEMRQRRR
jgi:hypothetical protein